MPSTSVDGYESEKTCFSGYGACRSALSLFRVCRTGAEAGRRTAARSRSGQYGGAERISARRPSFRKDRHLLDRLQYDAFRYIWDHTFPESGLAYEDSRNKETGQATIGGSGFGVAAIVVAAERGWISHQDALDRVLKIATFLRDKTDRKNLHGAFPHWLDGRTGKTISFGEQDNGADLVETAFMMQGLLIARAYFTADTEQEKAPARLHYRTVARRGLALVHEVGKQRPVLALEPPPPISAWA